jgi:hypothetical protein
MYTCVSQEPRLAGTPGEGHSCHGHSALCCAVRGAGVQRGFCLWDGALSGWFRRMERNDRADDWSLIGVVKLVCLPGQAVRFCIRCFVPCALARAAV